MKNPLILMFFATTSGFGCGGGAYQALPNTHNNLIVPGECKQTFIIKPNAFSKNSSNESEEIVLVKLKVGKKGV